jgi:hypothetical protein
MSSTDFDDGSYVRPFLTGSSSAAVSDEMSNLDGVPLVRAYTMTGGRADTTVQLAFEAMLGTTEVGVQRCEYLTFERRSIVELCARETLSVVEVSARLSLPIGVVRVLAGDLIADGTLDVQEASEDVADDVSLILRLIEGVRAL